MTWDFVNQNRVHLEHTSDIEPHKVYPSRRSWAHFDKALRDAKANGCDLLAIDAENKISMDVYFIGEGFIGQEASIAFRDFVENYAKQVSVEDVLAGRKQNLIKDFGVNDSNAMLEKVAESDEIKKDLDATQLANLAKFLYAIQAELVMKAWEKLTRANAETVKKLWVVEVEPGKTFGYFIAEIVGDDVLS